MVIETTAKTASFRYSTDTAVEPFDRPNFHLGLTLPPPTGGTCGEAEASGRGVLRLSTRSSTARRLSSHGIPTQFLKFCVVGGSGYVINLLAYTALLHAAGFSYLLAAAGAFILAATNNYTWNRLWTFRAERGGIALQGTQFLVVAGAALSANLLLLRVLVELGIGPVPAQATAIVLVTPLNFLGNKVWTFQHRVLDSPPRGRPDVRARQRTREAALLVLRLRRPRGAEPGASQLEETALAPATVPEAS